MMKYPSLIKEREVALMTLPDTRWLATEKLHGTNMQFLIECDSIRVFRRNGELKKGDTFYDWENILERLREPLLELFALTKATKLSVFGELVGGQYPGFPHKKPVQKKILYCPDYEFVVFDVYDYERFLDFEEVVEYCSACKLHVVPILCRGLTFKEIQAIDHEDDVSIAPEKIFGLTESVPQNYIEGWVIRPMQELDSGRWLIKRRTKRFMDCAGVSTGPSSSSSSFLEEALTCVTEARLLAVKSKELEKTDIGTLSELMYQDILDELQPEEPVPVKVQKAIRGKIGAFIHKAS